MQADVVLLKCPSACPLLPSHSICCSVCSTARLPDAKVCSAFYSSSPLASCTLPEKPSPCQDPTIIPKLMTTAHI